MFGLDDYLASYTDGAGIWIVLLVAVLLGLRHATDPDHVAAVTTLVAGSRERTTRRAAELGAAWGLGHAVTLFAFGVRSCSWTSTCPNGCSRPRRRRSPS